MRSIKAILIGSLFILTAHFLFGFIYMFIAVGYNALAADYPFLNDITGWFRYLIGIPLYIATMFFGGYITANIAKMHGNFKVWLHCLVVGFISVFAAMYSVLEYATLTLTGILIIILALSASSAGGFYWLRDHKLSQ